MLKSGKKSLIVKDLEGKSGFLKVAAQGGTLDNGDWLTAINYCLDTYPIHDEYVDTVTVRNWDHKLLLRTVALTAGSA